MLMCILAFELNNTRKKSKKTLHVSLRVQEINRKGKKVADRDRDRDSDGD